jgi:stringent starvation protein B
MTSNRPYLIRALYEWIVDNQMTPYVLVDTEMPGVNVPRQYIEDGKIILNIAANAVQSLKITNQIIEFEASFGGIPTKIYAPVRAVLAIYARENGRGMVFPQDIDEEETDPPPPVKTGKPKLTVVK